MKLEETQITKMTGGVFFDQLVDPDWPGLYERVRLRVRRLLQDFQTTPSFDSEVASRRIAINYDQDEAARKIIVTDESIMFEVGRFAISAGVPRDIGIALEVVLKAVNRNEWNEIGCAFVFVLPSKRGQVEGQPALDFLSAKIDLNFVADLMPLDCCELVQIELRGTSGHQRVKLGLGNTLEQDIVAVLDTRIPFMHFQHSDIPAHFEDLLRQFTAHFAPLFQSVMQTPGLVNGIDTRLLREGESRNRTL